MGALKLFSLNVTKVDAMSESKSSAQIRGSELHSNKSLTPTAQGISASFPSGGMTVF